MPKISDKALKKVIEAISEGMPLDDVEEFDLYMDYKLFTGPLNTWNNLEDAICDYQSRVQSAMIERIKKIFGREEHSKKEIK